MSLGITNASDHASLTPTLSPPSCHPSAVDNPSRREFEKLAQNVAAIGMGVTRPELEAALEQIGANRTAIGEVANTLKDTGGHTV